MTKTLAPTTRSTPAPRPACRRASRADGIDVDLAACGARIATATRVASATAAVAPREAADAIAHAVEQVRRNGL